MSGFYSITALSQILVNGILFGSMYGVAAIGLSLIYGAMDIIFIAQGSMMILAAYLVYWLFEFLSMDPFLSLLICIPVFLGIGWMVYVGLFQWVAKDGKNPSLLLAFGLMVVLESVMCFLWTADPRAITTSYTGWGLPLAGLHISFVRLMVFAMSLLGAAFVFLFMKKTLWGKAVKAASEDMIAASLLGISPKKVSSITFGIGIALGGVAGVATATTYAFEPYFGFVFSLKALIAVAFGGLGSVAGALLGGILLGVIESVGSYFIGGGWADAISFTMFILVIVFRPQGMFGRPIVKV
jgi:branched-chain amino acid transport system permease protein